MNSDVNKISEPGILDSAEHAVKAAKTLAEGNLGVFSAEFNVAMAKFRPKLTRLTVAATLIVLGLIAFLAFAIIGLGALLDGRYWLSSLIVAAVCGVAGGALFATSVEGLSELFHFERTRKSVDRTVLVAKQTFEEIKAASSGENRESITTANQ